MSLAVPVLGILQIAFLDVQGAVQPSTHLRAKTT
jgi:hypothetical protein